MKKFLLGLLTGLIISIIPATLALSPAYPNYKDVSKDDWYYSYSNNLYGLGIISGYEDNTFRGNNFVNRAELAKIVSETYKKLATDYEVESLHHQIEGLNAKLNSLDVEFPGDCYYEDNWYDSGDEVEGFDLDGSPLECRSDGFVR